MNGQTAELVKYLIGVCGAAGIAVIGVIYGARKNAAATERAATLKADSDAALKSLDGHVLLQAKLVDGQGLFEERVLKELTRQDSKMRELEGLLDDERKQRRLLETALHLSDQRVGDLEKQVVLLQQANAEALEKIVKLNDENRQRKIECEEQIRLLTDELICIRAERDALQKKLDAMLMVTNIGSLENIDSIGKDTNKRVRGVEQKVEKAAETLRKKEEGDKP